MHDQVTELAQRGKALLPEERSRLVDILLESLHEPAIAEVEAAWEVEIERRLAEHDRGDDQRSPRGGVQQQCPSAAKHTRPDNARGDRAGNSGRTFGQQHEPGRASSRTREGRNGAIPHPRCDSDPTEHGDQAEEVVERFDLGTSPRIPEQGHQREAHPGHGTRKPPEPATRNQTRQARGKGAGERRDCSCGKLSLAQHRTAQGHRPRHAGRLAKVQMLKKPRQQILTRIEHLPTSDRPVPLALRQTRIAKTWPEDKERSTQREQERQEPALDALMRRHE